jgi:Flp pilus assembly pilin Flp
MDTSLDLQPGQDAARRGQRGASLIEYVLLLALIALVCVAALTYFGTNSKNSLGNSCHQIISAGGGTSPNC